MDARFFLSLLVSYLLGSIPVTQIVARLVKNVDLRKVGSHNVGGRNLTRQLGLLWGILGGAGDVAKGAAAMLAAQALGVESPYILLNGPAAVAGHNWPIWLKFQGGKGVLTAMGAIAAIAFPEAAIAFALGILILIPTHNIVAAAVPSFLTMLVLSFVFQRPAEVSWFIAGTWAVVLVAGLPETIKKLMTPGAIAEYFREPDRVYREEAQKRRNP
ncbi:MAG TPA: glycerol-3-phosphate acyltransferase [Anaerolineales bacterium]|nr:glycerol-3-phosphate acyltransferase [Anaerolineales bacterium]